MGNCVITPVKNSGVTPTGTAKVVTINLSNSYATGGDTVTLASLGVGNVNALSLCSSCTSPGGHAVEVIHGAAGVAPKLRARDVATGAELGAASDQSAQSIRAIVYGDLPNP